MGDISPLVYVAIFMLSALMCGIYRALAIRSGWLDISNHRSSHVGAIPRGVGIVFALILIATLFVWATPPLLWLACGGLVAAIGWIDDLRPLGKKVRLLSYTLAIFVPMVAWLLLYRVAWSMHAGLFGALLAAIFFLWLWLLNLYNFMDGINGIAAVQALFVLSGVLILHANGSVAAPWYLLTVAVLAGYLPWNFPVARIFMGDAGSAFLGYWLGGLALLASMDQPKNLCVWLILLGVFVVDASWTLLTRFLTGQQWHAPHRSHLYQILSRRWNSHPAVVLAMLLFNIGWLLPCAWLVREAHLAPALGMVLAYSPLVVMCAWLRAGREPQ